MIIQSTSTEVIRNNVSLIKIIRHWIYGIDWNDFLLEGSSMSFTSASQRPAIKKSMVNIIYYISTNVRDEILLAKYVN